MLVRPDIVPILWILPIEQALLVVERALCDSNRQRMDPVHHVVQISFSHLVQISLEHAIKGLVSLLDDSVLLLRGVALLLVPFSDEFTGVDHLKE